MSAGGLNNAGTDEHALLLEGGVAHAVFVLLEVAYGRSRVLIHTIEDPIEYEYVSQRAFVTQRELGRDTDSFAEGLRRSMREDPDVVVVGEMRDFETMPAALTLAETGHPTFATLHTASAIQTISRVISTFPAAQQAQTRIQLASTLQYVICQKLVPWDNGEGRSLAAEILAVTPAVVP